MLTCCLATWYHPGVWTKLPDNDPCACDLTFLPVTIARKLRLDPRGFQPCRRCCTFHDRGRRRMWQARPRQLFVTAFLALSSGVILTPRWIDNGITVDVGVADTCVGCSQFDIDLSPAAFQSLASLDLGRIPVQWRFL